jgi:hypothetical protein
MQRLGLNALELAFGFERKVDVVCHSGRSCSPSRLIRPTCGEHENNSGALL